VPGLLRDKLIALLKALPKQHRRPLVPVPDTVDVLLGRLERAEQPLCDAVAIALREWRNVQIPREAWDEASLDPFYRMNLRVVAADGEVVAEGRDVEAIRQRFVERSRGEVARAAPRELPKAAVTRWDFGVLPASVRVKGAGLDLPGFPVVRDAGEAVRVETLADAGEAARVHRGGLRRLLLIAVAQEATWLRRNLLRDTRSLLVLGSRFGRDALVEDILHAAVDGCLPEDALEVRSPADFASLERRCKADITARARQMEALLGQVAAACQAVLSRRELLQKPGFQDARADIDAQFARLIRPDFLLRVPPRWRERIPVYLRAIDSRIEKLGGRLVKDRECVRELGEVQARLDDWQKRHPGGDADADVVSEYRWMIEEYRISLFAQQLGTVGPVSRKRLEKLWEELPR
jgi:ATP-dependent helicase HrpA